MPQIVQKQLLLDQKNYSKKFFFFFFFFFFLSIAYDVGISKF
jgi:hypothetical protein